MQFVRPILFLYLGFILSCGGDEAPVVNGSDTSPKHDMTSPETDVTATPDQGKRDVVDLKDSSQDMAPEVEVCDDNLDNDKDGLPDCADSDCDSETHCQAIPEVLPSDFPSRSGAGTLSPADFMGRWFDANDPIQPGADLSKYNPITVGLLRGKIIDTDGRPIAGAKIDTLNRPEFGHTFSRNNGEFDLLIPGDTRAAVRVQKKGHPEVQRRFALPKRNIKWVSAPIVMTRYSTESNEIEFNSEAQFVTGPMEDDGEGARQPSVYFPQGVTAEFEKDDGTRIPAGNKITLRMTEYTVGDLGSQAMPGDIPITTDYTWAAEFSADEAVEIGARHVHFSKPVSIYLDNFINLPAGLIVPFGIFETGNGAWVAESDGFVGTVIAIENGLATVDIDGDGVAETDSDLQTWGFDDKERELLATRFSAGETFWRVVTGRFSPTDLNMSNSELSNSFPNARALNRKGKKRGPSTVKRRCKKKGSIIDCGTRKIRDAVGIAKTNYSVVVFGEVGSNSTIEVDFLKNRTLADLGTGLAGASLSVEYEGHRIDKRFTVEELTSNPNRTIDLPLEDVWGGEITGIRTATVIYSFIYNVSLRAMRAAARSNPNRSSFDDFSNGRTSNIVTSERGVSTLSNRSTLMIPNPNKSETRHLNVVHRFEVGPGILRYGNGEQDTVPTYSNRTGATFDDNKDCVNCVRPELFDGEKTNLGSTTGITAISPDGEVYGIGPVRLYENGDGVDLSSYQISFPHYLYRRSGKDAKLLHQVNVGSGTNVLRPFAAGRGKFKRDGNEICFPAGSYDSIRCVDIWTGIWTDLFSVDDAVSETLQGGYRPTRILDFAFADDAYYILEEGNITGGGNIRVVRKLGYENGDQEVIHDSFTENKVNDLQLLNLGARLTVDEAGYPVVSISVFNPGMASASVLVRIRPGGFDFLTSIGTNGSHPTEELPTVLLSDWEYRGEAYFFDNDNCLVLEVPIGAIFGRRGIARACNNELSLLTGDTGFACSTTDGVDARNCNADQLLGVGMGGTILAGGGVGLGHSLNPALEVVDGDWHVESPTRLERYVFDPAGRILSTHSTQTGGVIRTFKYDNSRRLVEIIEAKGDVTAIEWRDDKIASFTSYNVKTDLLYDAKGALESVVHPDGTSDGFVFDDRGRMIERTSPKGDKTTYSYDSGDLAEVTLPGNLGTKKLTEQAQANGVEVTFEDPLGLQTKYFESNTSSSYISRITYPWGASSELREEIAAGDAVRMVTGADGTIVVWRNNAADKVDALISDRQIILPSLKTLEIERRATKKKSVNKDFYESRQMTLTKRPGSGGQRQWRKTWDGNALTQTVRSPNGSTFQTIFNPQGQIVSERSAGLNPTTYTYGQTGKPESLVQGTRSWTYTWDGSYIDSMTNASGEAFLFQRDSQDRLLKFTRPDGQKLNYEWSEDSEETAFITPMGNRYDMAYDEESNRTSFTAPGKNPIRWEFEKAQRLSKVTLQSGTEITRTYDNVGRILTIDYPDATIQFGYEGTNGIATQVDRISKNGRPTHTIQKSYDGSLLESQTTTYDARMRIDTFSRNGYFEVTQLSDGLADLGLERDASGLLTKIGNWNVRRSGVSKLPSRYSQGDVAHNLNYDSNGLVIGRTFIVNGATIDSWTRTLDVIGRETSVSKTDEAALTTDFTYTYDLNGDLKTVSEDGVQTVTYGYDFDRNRIEVNGKIVSYNSAGEIQDFDGVPVLYDSDGRLANDGNWMFDYSARGELLTAIRNSDMKTITYGWDGVGRMISRTSDAKSIFIRYGDPFAPYRITAIEEDDGTIIRYIYDGAGNLIEMRRGATTYFVSTDLVGTPRVYTDELGGIIKRITREPFGEIVSETATLWNPWVGFAGGFEDPETGLVRFWHRDYHIEHARWTVIDPSLFSGSPQNLWLYAENSPTTHSDPTGLFCVGFSVFGGIGAGIEGCITEKGFSNCVEVGFGLGGGVGFKPFGDIASDGREVEAVVNAAFLALSVEVGAKLTECGDFTGIFKLGAGPFTKDFTKGDGGKDAQGSGDTVTPHDGAKGLADNMAKAAKVKSWKDVKINGKIQGKIAGKDCRSVKF